jgi:microcystin-dependent protein
MSSIYDWSTTASSNATADSAINWAEGQAPGSVNDSARGMMKRIKEMLNDLGGVANAGGTANAVTVSSSSPFTAYSNGLRVTFRAASDNTAATTLSVNSIGAKSIRKFTLAGEVALSGGEIQEDGIYELVYNADFNSAGGGWLLLNPSQVDVVQAGVILPFGGTTAPLGTLSCDGTAVSRTTYAALFAAIGTTWGAGNGTTTFNVPDLRDDFLRGASGTLTVGTKQTDTLKTHTHTGTTADDTHTHTITSEKRSSGQGNVVSGNINLVGTLGDVGVATTATTQSDTHNHTFTTNATGDTETRPRNGVVLWVIKT